MPQARRGILLTIFALLFALLAIEDFLKPFHLEGADTGIVLFGHRFQGSSAYLGWLVAIFLLVYAAGIWRMRRYARALGYVYAVYIVVNIVAFTLTYPTPTERSQQIFGIVFSILAIGGSWLAAILLNRRRAELT
jgi:hypothetical protein